VQLDKDAGPYLKPTGYYRTPAVRRAAATMAQQLIRELRVRPVYGFGTIAPNTLTAMLTREFDTLTLAKYHLHLKHGVEHFGAHGIAVLQMMAKSLDDADVTAQGRISASFPRKLMQRAAETWAGFLRPALGEIRRGRVRISLTRNALIDPQ
jgi:hypothetical protein